MRVRDDEGRANGSKSDTVGSQEKVLLLIVMMKDRGN